MGAILIRLPTVEGGRLELHRPCEEPGCDDAERDVGRVLPVMRDRREGIVLGRRAMHERHWTDGGFARRGDVEREAERVRDQGTLVKRRQLHEEIVRMLDVMDVHALVELAGLEQLRIAGAADLEWVRAEHGAEVQLPPEEG